MILSYPDTPTIDVPDQEHSPGRQTDARRTMGERVGKLSPKRCGVCWGMLDVAKHRATGIDRTRG